jgi:hypothetical protein
MSTQTIETGIIPASTPESLTNDQGEMLCVYLCSNCIR